ncbi:MAG: PAS domain S-box protein, partial [Planctomycetota bacterium]
MRIQRGEFDYSGAEYKRTARRFYQRGGLSHLFAVYFLTIFLLSISGAEAQTNQSRKILILNAYHKGLKWTDDEVRGAKAVLLKEIKDVEIYIEYLDTKRIRCEDYLELYHELLQIKYGKVELDALIATDDNALRYLLEYEEELFGQVPVVFCGVNDFEESMLDGRSNITGLTEALEFKPTIDLALKLHPGSRRIVVISDGTPTGLGHRKDIIAVESQYESLKFEYLNGEELSTAELLEKLGDLPTDSIALFTTWMWDKTGEYIPAGDTSISEILASSSVPIYGFTDMWLNRGIVGGKLLNGRTHGRDAAGLVLRILGGENPGDIPVHIESNNPYMFDYNQLKRRQINISDLPEGSIIINEPKTFYYLYKTQIWAAVVIIGCLGVMVIILSANILRRKRVEETLAHSESIYRKAIENAHGVPYELRYSDGKYVFMGSGIKELFGVAEEEMTLENTLKTMKEITNLGLGDYENFEECYQAFRQGETDHLQLDARISTPDGRTKWFSNSVLPVRDRKTGEVTGSIGILQDITERKQAEEALAHSESIYRGAIENAQGVPYQVRFSDGKYAFMGSGAKELLEISPDKLTREKLCEMVENVIIMNIDGHEGLEAYRNAFEKGEIGRYQADFHYR